MHGAHDRPVCPDYEGNGGDDMIACHPEFISGSIMLYSDPELNSGKNDSLPYIYIFRSLNY